MIILIPCYEPDEKLITLLDAVDLAAADTRIVLVDDGSGSAYAHLYDQARARGCDVVGYATNKGKGHALKTGFAYIAERYPGQSVVCADCDGQHRVKDIVAVAQRVASSPDTMVLGVRRFTGRVPLRSRFGNAVTRKAFWLATGVDVVDTQTGLRGYPSSMLAWLCSVRGDRFEYELNLLLQAKPSGYAIDQVDIDTVYLAGNASSHFRPVVDSARIYAPLLRFAGSSLGGFGIDVLALLALNALTGNLLASVIGARVLSSLFNFTANRSLVFTQGRSRAVWDAALRYYVLVVVVLAANYGLLSLLTGLGGVPLVVAKLITEVTLFFVSYHAQRAVVYTQPFSRHDVTVAAPTNQRRAVLQ